MKRQVGKIFSKGERDKGKGERGKGERRRGQGKGGKGESKLLHCLQTFFSSVGVISS
jgi:hypothetical protein